MAENRYYLCIDMKSFYASVECAQRNLNPFETNLVVADTSRGYNALCLAITPKMKSLGVKNRCRLSDIPKDMEYIAAPPRMRFYIEYAADIYEIYLKYFSPQDIHIYSIDESFIDVTNYLLMHKTDAVGLAKVLMNDIANTLHIPSTAGVGTNLYLAKIALDITAKHSADHIGYLDEELYKKTLWDHKPITDFWHIASGISARLASRGIFTMRDIAMADEKVLYKLLGKDAELLIDHAFGREPCLISDIKNYRSSEKSVSFSQILPRSYSFGETKVILSEMILNASHELMKRHVIANKLWIGVGYAGNIREMSKGSIKMRETTAVYSIIMPYAENLFEKITDKNTPIRRIGISFSGVCDEGCEGYDFFTDFDAVEKEKTRENAVISLYEKFGKNAVLRGTNLVSCATARERNGMIGGHRAGYDDKRRTR